MYKLLFLTLRDIYYVVNIIITNFLGLVYLLFIVLLTPIFFKDEVLRF